MVRARDNSTGEAPAKKEISSTTRGSKASSSVKKKNGSTGVWPCKINGCTKQFAREADLKRHQRTTKLHATSVAGSQCPQCDATFTRTDALRRHQKSRHNGVVIESEMFTYEDERDSASDAMEYEDEEPSRNSGSSSPSSASRRDRASRRKDSNGEPTQSPKDSYYSRPGHSQTQPKAIVGSSYPANRGVQMPKQVHISPEWDRLMNARYDEDSESSSDDDELPAKVSSRQLAMSYPGPYYTSPYGATTNGPPDYYRQPRANSHWKTSSQPSTASSERDTYLSSSETAVPSPYSQDEKMRGLGYIGNHSSPPSSLDEEPYSDGFASRYREETSLRSTQIDGYSEDSATRSTVLATA